MIFETSTFPFKGAVLRKPDGEESSTIALSSLVVTQTEKVTLRNVLHLPSGVTESYQNSSIASNVISQNESRAVLPTPVSSTTPMSFETVFNPTSSPKFAITDKESNLEDIGIILLPVLILLCIAISSTIFYLMRKKKKLDDFRHRIVPVYNFSPGEEEEWGVLLDQQTQAGQPSQAGQQ